MVRKPSRTGAAGAGVMDALLCNSVFKRDLKSSAGISRSAPAIRTRVSSSRPDVWRAAPASMASMAWLSCSSSARSGMSALHLSPEILDGPKLKLLNGAFTAPEFKSDLTDTLLFHEAHLNHAELRFREPIDQLKQHGAAFDFGGSGGVRLLRRTTGLPAGALPMVGKNARGDPQ